MTLREQIIWALSNEYVNGRCVRGATWSIVGIVVRISPWVPTHLDNDNRYQAAASKIRAELNRMLREGLVTRTHKSVTTYQDGSRVPQESGTTWFWTLT